MADGDYGSWDQVSQQYGASVAQILQNNNVPLSQVGSTISSIPSGLYTNPSQAITTGGGGTTGATMNQGALAQALYSKYGGGAGSTTAPGGLPVGTGGPNAQLSNLGAAALLGAGFGANYGGTPIYNPYPTNANAQSGVGQIGTPTQGVPARPGQLGGMYGQGGSLQLLGTPGGGFNPGVTTASANLPVGAATPTAVYGGVANPNAQPGAALGRIQQSPLYGQGSAATPPLQPAGTSGTSAGFMAPPGAPGYPSIGAYSAGANNLPRPGLSVHAAGTNPSSPTTAMAPVQSAGLPIKQFQSGGVVTQPTIALMGESGPEAVVPIPTTQTQRRTDPSVPAASIQVPAQPTKPVSQAQTTASTPTLATTPSSPPPAPGGTGTGSGTPGSWSPYGGVTATGAPQTPTQTGMGIAGAGISQAGQAVSQAYSQEAQNIAKMPSPLSFPSGIPSPQNYAAGVSNQVALAPEQNPSSEMYQRLAVV